MGKRRDILPGIVYMLLGGVAMSIQGLGVRILKADVTVEFTLFIRFLICFLISLFVNLVVRGAVHGWRFNNLPLLLTRSVSAFVALVICFFAIQYYNAGLVFVFFFSTPLFLPIIARFWLKIPILHRLWFGLFIALVGMVCVLQPGSSEIQFGLLYVLIAAVLAGVSNIGVRLLHRTDSTKIINLSYFGIGVLGAFLILLFSRRPYIFTFTSSTLFFLLITGITGYLYQLFLTQALKYAPSRILSPFNYSATIFSLIIEAAFFGLIPSFFAMLGVLLVILGTVINVFLFPSEDIQRVGK